MKFGKILKMSKPGDGYIEVYYIIPSTSVHVWNNLKFLSWDFWNLVLIRFIQTAKFVWRKRLAEVLYILLPDSWLTNQKGFKILGP